MAESGKIMRAMVATNDGYSNTAEGPAIETLEPYVELVEQEIPVPNDKQVVIDVSLGNINPSDLHFIKGEYGQPRRKGVAVGFEGVGTVCDAGKHGQKLIGQRVAFFVSADGSGSWSSHALTDAMNCIPLRDDVRDEDAATLFVNPLTAIAMIDEVKNSGTESFIMTAASSQLCKLMAGLAKEEGLKAIGIVRNDAHIKNLLEVGFSHVLNQNADDFQKQLASISRELKPRVMLDALSDNVASSIFDMMPNRARWIIYGKLSAETLKLRQPGQLIFMDKSIEGFWLVKWFRNTEPARQIMAIQKVQEMFATGDWKTDIKAIVPLDGAMKELPEALAGINTGKVMIKP